MSSVPLDPAEAATLFRSGAQLAFVAAPKEWFVAGQWQGQLSLVTPIPFADPQEYFTTHPVMVFDPNYLPTGPAVSATITAGQPTRTPAT
jgi:hypothetical protein